MSLANFAPPTTGSAPRARSRGSVRIDTPVVADHFSRESVRLVRSCKSTQSPAGSRYCPGRRKLGKSHEMFHRDYRSLGSSVMQCWGSSTAARDVLCGKVYSLWKSRAPFTVAPPSSQAQRSRRATYSYRSCGSEHSSFILAHNHPSGSPEPSREDIEFTEKIAHAGDLLGIQLLDHIIVARSGAVSLSEEGCTSIPYVPTSLGCE